MEVVRQTKTIYTKYGYKTQVLTAAVRHPTHVLEAALAGSDVCTLAFDVLEQLYNHPLTDLGIEIFLKDWAKVPKA
jgi:transaldolase